MVTQAPVAAFGLGPVALGPAVMTAAAGEPLSQPHGASAAMPVPQPRRVFTRSAAAGLLVLLVGVAYFDGRLLAQRS